MNLRSPLGQVRGLGSAKEGTVHWWHQRVTAIALIFLSVWFVVSLIFLTGASYEEAHAWIANPIVTGASLLLIVFTFYHMKLGIQVVAEDYVHREWLKIAVIIFTDFACIVIGLASVLAILLVAFRS